MDTEPVRPLSRIDLESARASTLARLQQTCDRLGRAELERQLELIDASLRAGSVASHDLMRDRTRLTRP